MKVLLDTNVLVDYFDAREPFYKDVVKLRIMQEFGDIDLWTSIQSFADIFSILKKGSRSSNLQQAFSASLSFLHVCSLDQADLETACSEKWNDLEDCLIEQCARKTKAEFLLTRDSDGFSQSLSTVLSPAEFFDYVLEHYGLSYEAIDVELSGSQQ